MSRISIWICLGILAGLVGCSPAPTAAKPAEESAKAEGTTEVVERERPVLPDELKNAAFDYYGLGMSTPVPMEIVTGSDQPTRSGTQVTRLKEVKDGVATFEISRTGSLADLGSMEVELRQDGVYVVRSSMGEIDGAHLELPADLAPGKTWKSSLKIKRSETSTIENAADFKVVGTEKVETPVGSYPDALVITSKGTAKIDGTSSEMETKGWFVKGRGAVKMSITTTSGGTKTSMTVQETK